MENYDEMFKSICRMCLNYKDSKKMVSLIDENCNDSLTAYAKAVVTFADINIKKQDCFPRNMCLKCLHFLKQAIYFKLVTESSDNCLKQLANSVRNDAEILKKKIVEYVMVRFYFPTECFKTNRKRCKILKNENSNEVLKPNLNVRNVKTAKENHLSNNEIIDIDFDDSPKNESDTEYNSTQIEPAQCTKILDKMENLIGHNECKSPVSMHNVIKRKKYLKRRNLAAKLRYKFELQQQRLHQKNNVKVRSLVCNICNKVLANQLTYDHHMQRHNGCRFICEHCGKGFPVLKELQIHQVTRHGTGPYHQCSHCPFKAPRKFDLIEHERIHSGERPYTCDKCGLTFRRRGIWKKHLIYHTEKKIQCPQCPRKFFQRSEMLAHANNIHDRVYVYLCSKCGATYAKTATVRRHMTERHGIPREMQGKIIRVKKGASYQE